MSVDRLSGDGEEEYGEDSEGKEGSEGLCEDRHDEWLKFNKAWSIRVEVIGVEDRLWMLEVKLAQG